MIPAIVSMRRAVVGLGVLALLATFATIACGASAASDSRVPQDARALIRKLEKTGLKVEVLGKQQERSLGPHLDAVQLRVDGRDRVFLYEYDEPQTDDVLFRTFNMYASFAIQDYPVIFRDGRIVLVVQGHHDEASTRVVYPALWDAPPADLLPFGLPPTDYYGLHRPIEFARVKLGWRPTEVLADPNLGDPEARLVRLEDYLRVLKIDERLYGSLPHPDTLVIAIMSRAPDRSRKPSPDWHVVLVTYGSKLMIGVDRSVDPSKVRALPAQPIQEDDY